MDLSPGRITNAVNQVLDSVGSSCVSVFDQLVSQTIISVDKLSSALATPVTPPPPEPWLKRNKLALFVGISAVGAAAWILLRPAPKRVCGNRVPDGGRQDVVLIVGSPAEPLVRLIIRELNLRSFIIYVCVSNDAEQHLVEQEHCEDIRAVRVNPMDPVSIAQLSASLNQILCSNVTTVQGGPSYYLHLAGVLMIPDLQYPQGPLELISQQDLETSIASKLVSPLFFLRGLLELVRQHHSRIVLLTPSIISSLCPPFHLMESMFTASLDQLALTMYRELRPQSIPFCQIKLGSFDVGTDFSGHQRQVVNSMRADILSWPEKVRHLYAGSYLDSSFLQTNRARGSSLNHLHDTIARALTANKPSRVMHTGRYGLTYEWLQHHAPESLLTWVLQ